MPGAHHRDHKTNSHFKADAEVVDVFQNNVGIQKSLGYNPLLVSQQQVPCVIPTSIPRDEKEDIPDFLHRKFGQQVFKQIHQLKLKGHDVLKRGYLVMINQPSSATHPYQIDSVQSIWPATVKYRTSYFLKGHRFSGGIIHPFYQMKVLERTSQIDYFEATDIIACLNAQHNCQSGRCQMVQGKKNTRPNYEGD
ncbi:hypothetical protein PSTT_02348 [Puccinia striiformis]|nr:hypothetical protein PSTG_01003 [Puccinia striiformis f. sp. tritici PST-78]POW15164.1 hypothetical protein PSTT_02348 [Puccinia striiformis]